MASTPAPAYDMSLDEMSVMLSYVTSIGDVAKVDGSKTKAPPPSSKKAPPPSSKKAPAPAPAKAAAPEDDTIEKFDFDDY